MKDIDFDELDRAVSSLMSNVPKEDSTDAVSADRESVVTLGSDASSTEEPEVPPTEIATPEPLSAPESEATELDAPAEEPEAPTVVTPAGVAPPPAARRGRFMDVKHPGAKEINRPAVAGPISRQAPTIEPLAAVDTTPAEVEAPTTDQPDPLASFQPETPAEPVTEAPAVEEASSEESPDAMTESAQEAMADVLGDVAPLSSPFLPDAKVEKRPLGRPAEPTPVVDLASELSEDAGDAMAEQPVNDGLSPNKDAQLPEQPLPAELGSELLSIETGADTSALDTPTASATPEVAEPVEPAPAPSNEPAPKPATETPRSMPVSIPQQYKVQPKKDEDAPAGAIYDAQPLAHPEKKKPVWLWVLAFVAIALLGIGGGIAVYYMGMN